MGISGLRLTRSTGDAVRALLADDVFRAALRALAVASPQATCFQDPDFLAAWYAVFPEYAPLAFTAALEDGRLGGTFFLAEKDGALVVAGDALAEYQGWLGLPECSRQFVTAVFGELAGMGRWREFRLGALPAALGTELAAVPGIRVLVRHERSPLLDIDAASLAASLKKPGNRSKHNRLARLGPVSFGRVSTDDAAGLERVLRRTLLLAALRHDAFHGTHHAGVDENTVRFYLRLLRTTDLAHFSALCVGQALVAAHLGFVTRSQGMVHLGCISHDPAYAGYSPGKLFLMYLTRGLHEEGLPVLDLTPGQDAYKERYATRHQALCQCRVFFSRPAFLLARGKLAARRAVKAGLVRCGIDPKGLRALVRALGQLADVRKLRRLPADLASAIRTKFSSREVAYYRLDRERMAGIAAPDPAVGIDDVAALLLYREKTILDSRARFLRRAMARLGAGEHCLCAVEAGRLRRCGWLSTEPQADGLAGLLGPAAEHRALLTECGGGSGSDETDVVRAMVLAALAWLHGRPDIGSTWIALDAGDAVSRRVVEALGFRYAQAGPPEALP